MNHLAEYNHTTYNNENQMYQECNHKFFKAGEVSRFDKHFIKNTRKKAPQGNILEFFLLDTLKMDTIRAFFFPKSGQFFRFLKKGRRGFSPPPLVASLCTNKKIDCTLIFFQESKISFILDHLSVYISYKVKMSFLKESIKDSFR